MWQVFEILEDIWTVGLEYINGILCLLCLFCIAEIEIDVYKKSTFFDVLLFDAFGEFNLKVVYCSMGFAETFLVPGLSIPAITASVHWVILYVVVSLMISIFETSFADAWTVTLHAVETSECAAWMLSQDGRTHWTLTGSVDRIAPVDGWKMLDGICLKEDFDEPVCPFWNFGGNGCDYLFEFLQLFEVVGVWGASIESISEGV